MARLSRFLTVAVLLGGATVFLSACTGDPAPTASPTPTPSAVVSETPSVSPSPTALSDEELLALIPEDARAENFVSASNFGRFMLKQYEAIFQTLDTRLWEWISAPDCEFCMTSVADVAELREASGSREGGVMTLTPDSGPASGGLRDDGFYYVGFRFEISARTDTDGAGNTIGSGAEASGDTALKLRHVDDHWVVYDIGTVPDQ